MRRTDPVLRRRALPVLVALAALVAFAVGAVAVALGRAGGDHWSAPPALLALAGRWTYGPGTEVRYRIGQRTGSVRSEALGRTGRVSGGLTLVGRDGRLVALRGATATVDMTSLRSDDPARDESLRTFGLETASYPTATFVTAFDAPVPPGVLERPTGMILRGVLTLHGVSRTLAVPVTARALPGSLVVEGRLDVTLADWGMRPPRIPGVLSVEPEGRFEIHLVFRRAS